MSWERLAHLKLEGNAALDVAALAGTQRPGARRASPDIDGSPVEAAHDALGVLMSRSMVLYAL